MIKIKNQITSVELISSSVNNKYGLTLTEQCPMVDPIADFGPKTRLILVIFLPKTAKNETNWTEKGHASLAAPWIHQ